MASFINIIDFFFTFCQISFIKKRYNIGVLHVSDTP